MRSAHSYTHRGDASDSDTSSSSSSQRQYTAVTCTGRQPNADVFVFGPRLQLDLNGEIIPEEDQEFVWIQDILDKLNRVVNPLPYIPKPGWANPLYSLIEGMQTIAGDNTISGVFLLGKVFIYNLVQTKQRIIFTVNTT